MTLRTVDRVLLAKLDATLTADSKTTVHAYYSHGSGQGSSRKETVWTRDVKPLGVGGMGTVYLERCTSGESVGSLRAVKCIQKPIGPAASKVSYANELQAVARFSQPKYAEFFVKSYGWYDTHDTVFIAMEYVALGDLQHQIGSALPESEVQTIVYQVLRGLSIMHAAGYAHRDLKPANLLVFNGRPSWQVKIADFGLSKRVLAEATSLRTQAGTTGFMAPEILGMGSGAEDSSDEEQEESYTNSVDMWAVGVIAFLLLTTQMPFPELRGLGRYVRGKSMFPRHLLAEQDVSAQGQAIIERFLARQPSERPKADICQQNGWMTRLAGTGHSTGRTEHISTLPTSSLASWTTKLSLDLVSSPIALQEDASDHTLDVNAQQKTLLTNEPTDLTTSPSRPPPRAPAELVEEKPVKEETSSVYGPVSSTSDVAPGAWPEHVHEDLTNETSVADRVSDAWTWSSKVEPPVIPDFTNAESMDDSTAEKPADSGYATWTSLSKEASLTVPETLHAESTASGRSTSVNSLFDLSATDVRLREVVKLKGHKGWASHICFSPDGTKLGSSSGDGTVRLWDARTGTEQRKVFGKLGMNATVFAGIAFSPDGKTFASTSSNGTIWEWRTATGMLLSSSLGQNVRLGCLAYTTDGKAIVASTRSKCLGMWDIASGKEEMWCPGHTDNIWGTALSTDGRLVASSSRDRTVRLWEVPSGQERALMTGHSDQVWAVAFSPDNKYVASGSLDGTVRLWDVETGRERKNLSSNGGYVWSLAFSPGGRVLAAGLSDSTIRIWDLEAEAEITQFIGSKGYVYSLAFSPDGLSLASSARDDCIRVWRLALDVDMWEYTAPEKSAEKLDRQGSLTPQKASEQAKTKRRKFSLFD